MEEPKTTGKCPGTDWEKFGKDIWEWVKENGGNIFNHEDSEEIMEIAQKHGLSKRVPYDPKKHGDVEYSDPGDEIWWLGD